MVAWRREKYVDKGGPAGGDGGCGGDVYLAADEDISTLLDFKHKSVFKAQNGENGGIKNMHGRCAKNLYIKVPVGTVVTDSKSGSIIADMNENGQKALMAKGGRGGRGNARFATAQKRAPQFCEPGEPGIERDLELELKLIADVGLLGMPNAGKSTLISRVSSAKPKIADYPFTTLVPNLGVVKKASGGGYVVADIPGLIEGASEGAGLGHEFLRHVERCRFLIHLVDAAAENPFENYKKINRELELHSESLAQRYQIVVLNKIDAISEDRKTELKEQFNNSSQGGGGYIKSFMISAVTGENLDALVDFMSQKVEEIPKIETDVAVEEDLDAYNNDDSDYMVYKINKNTFAVEGGKISRLAGVTDSRNLEQVLRLQNILKSMGVFEEVKKLDIKDGNTIVLGHLEFEYYEDEMYS